MPQKNNNNVNALTYKMYGKHLFYRIGTKPFYRYIIKTIAVIGVHLPPNFYTLNNTPLYIIRSTDEQLNTKLSNHISSAIN